MTYADDCYQVYSEDVRDMLILTLLKKCVKCISVFKRRCYNE